jgi:molybdate transport system substrate-binding protein
VRSFRVVALLVMAACVSACSAIATGGSSGAPGSSGSSVAAGGSSAELTIFAAASLKDALAAVKGAYEAAVPGTTLTIATDSSSTLRTQIEQGAPADLFLSADQKNPQTLVDAGLTDGPAVDIAGNLLSVIVPADNPAGIATPADLARAGIKIVAAGEDVPITTYAEQLVDNLGALPGYPAGFSQAYAANVITREQNVKAVTAKIELGEGDAAIVYVTDAATSKGVATIDVPEGVNVPATYAAVVVAASTRHGQAHAFLDWLVGPSGVAVMARFGFLPPP